jgi:hypothetical protein
MVIIRFMARARIRVSPIVIIGFELVLGLRLRFRVSVHSSVWFSL